MVCLEMCPIVDFPTPATDVIIICIPCNHDDGGGGDVMKICLPCASKCFRVTFSWTVAADPDSGLSENFFVKHSDENIPCKDCSSNSRIMADVIGVQAGIGERGYR